MRQFLHGQDSGASTMSECNAFRFVGPAPVRAWVGCGAVPVGSARYSV